MGRAKILSKVDKSKYSVELMLNNERVELAIQQKTKSLEEAKANLKESEEKLENLKLEVDELWMLVDALIKKWEEDELDDPDLDKMLLLHNAKRAEYGLPELVGVSALHSAAQGHATWLRQNEAYGHTGFAGSQPSNRISGAGYNWTVFGGGYGENVVVGVPGTQAAFDAWMASPGHAANIKNPNFTHIGLGYSQDTKTTYRWYWCVTYGYLAEGQPFTPAAPGAPEILANPSDTPPPIEEALKKMRTAATKVELEEVKRDTFKEQVENLEKWLQDAQAILDREVNKTVWVSDYTQTLTAGQVVGTIEIPQEGIENTIIYPDRIEGAGWELERDGFMQYRDAQSPEQVFYNAAVLPGWQKFKPKYRIGVINALNKDDDTADVTLVDARSSAQGLNINRYTDLPGIPVNYMTCHAKAFEVGDRVVVQFDDGKWNTARVIGFEENPRPCVIWPEVRIVLDAYYSTPTLITTWGTSYPTVTNAYCRYWSRAAGTRTYGSYDRDYKWGFVPKTTLPDPTSWSMRWPDVDDPPEGQAFTDFKVTAWPNYNTAPIHTEKVTGSVSSAMVIEVDPVEGNIPAKAETVYDVLLTMQLPTGGTGTWRNHAVWGYGRGVGGIDLDTIYPRFIDCTQTLVARQEYIGDGAPTPGATGEDFEVAACDNPFLAYVGLDVDSEYNFATTDEVTLTDWLRPKVPEHIEVEHTDPLTLEKTLQQYDFYRARFLRVTGVPKGQFRVVAAYRHPDEFDTGTEDVPEWTTT